MDPPLNEFNFPWSTSRLPKQLFINNKYFDAVSPTRLTVTNPTDASIVADDVPSAGEDDVENAVAAAEEAFRTWKKSTFVFRRQCLLRLADLIDANAAALGELNRLTLGVPKPFGQLEIQLASESFRYFAGWTDKFSGESYPQDDGFLKIVRNEPLGVTCGIIPWNVPIATIGTKAAPALATGNTFILKPSEKTPFAALALGSLIVEAGFPPGVFQVLSGDGHTGALLASHPRIRKISFTGSLPVGRKIQELAAKSNLKRVTLELGGKNPAIVFDDCQLEEAVQWCANGITMNSGQACVAASLVYVQDGVYDKFLAAYKSAIEKRGHGLGPLVDAAQFSRVRGFIDRGKSDGTVLTGGQDVDHNGYFVQPTVFTDVADSAEISREEIFGPVAVVSLFSTEEEIISKANNSEFGLMSGVFTQDINRAMRIASELETGMVGINCISKAFHNVPFGGTKQSGVGRENSINVLRSYTEPKTVFINLTRSYL